MTRLLRKICLVTAGLLAAVVLYGCAGFHDVNTHPSGVDLRGKAEPCRDSLFLALKSRPLESLSDREYEYLLQKDRQCAEYQKSGPPDSNTNGAVAGALIFGALLVVGALIYVASYNPYHY